jgi:hypothetical protein
MVAAATATPGQERDYEYSDGLFARIPGGKQPLA